MSDLSATNIAKKQNRSRYAGTGTITAATTNNNRGCLTPSPIGSPGGPHMTSNDGRPTGSWCDTSHLYPPSGAQHSPTGQRHDQRRPMNPPASVAWSGSPNVADLSASMQGMEVAPQIHKKARCAALDMSDPKNLHTIVIPAHVTATAEVFLNGEASYEVPVNLIKEFLEKEGVESFNPSSRLKQDVDMSKAIITRVERLSVFNSLPNQVEITLDPALNIMGNVLHVETRDMSLDHVWAGSDSSPYICNERRVLYTNHCTRDAEAMKWAHISPESLTTGVSKFNERDAYCYVPEENVAVEVLKQNPGAFGYNLKDATQDNGYYRIPDGVHRNVVNAIDAMAYDKLTFSDLNKVNVIFKNAAGGNLCATKGTRYGEMPKTDNRISYGLHKDLSFTVGVTLAITFCLPRCGPPMVPGEEYAASGCSMPSDNRPPRDIDREEDDDYDSDDDDDEEYAG